MHCDDNEETHLPKLVADVQFEGVEEEENHVAAGSKPAVIVASKADGYRKSLITKFKRETVIFNGRRRGKQLRRIRSRRNNRDYSPHHEQTSTKL